MTYLSKGKNLDLTVRKLQKILNEFEKTPAWDAPRERKRKIQHLAHHLLKLCGKLGELTERWDHKINPDETKLNQEVIPDLLYTALSIAKEQKVDLQDAFLKRLDANEKRVAGWVNNRKKK